MSIVKLVKVTLIGHALDKEAVVEDLQELGCVHLIPLATGEDVRGQLGPSTQAREALKFLLSCPGKRRQVRAAENFDAETVERAALTLKGELQDLEDERDFLVKRIGDLAPWGDFDFADLREMGGVRMWFYLVPHYRMKDLESLEVRYEVVHRDNRFCYVVVLAAEEPEDMPVARTHTGPLPRHELERRLEDVELAIEDAIAERVSLTRWCLLFARSLDSLEDRAARAHAARMTLDADPVFGLQGWAPRDRVAELEGYARDMGLVLEIAEPAPDESPPTLFDNPPAVAGGQDLVTFYMTPGYWTWDPSGVVLYSFALFFAMILADTGYAAVLALVLWRYWSTLGESEGGRRFRTTFTTIVVVSAVYGVLAGSYFGIELPEGSPLLALKVIDITDPSVMMAVSVVIGAAHVALANVMDAYRRGPTAAALPPLGWAAATVGGLVLAGGMMYDGGTATSAGTVLMVIGLALVFLFSGQGGVLSRLVGGLLALTGVTNAFGDVMSYLRLFALGLATASLAAAFNGMAADIREAVPGLGLLAAGLVLIIGHAMNFVLGLMSAVVHGLRLNVIEFFKWGLKEEGTLFRPLERKERAPWKPSS